MTEGAAAADWILVFMRSRGCKRRVEHVPLTAPAAKDLAIGV